MMMKSKMRISNFRILNFTSFVYFTQKIPLRGRRRLRCWGIDVGRDDDKMMMFSLLSFQSLSHSLYAPKNYVSLQIIKFSAASQYYNLHNQSNNLIQSWR